MSVRLRNGKPTATGYNEPVIVVRYVHDVVVVTASFGTFVLSPTSVAYIEDGKIAVADIRREGREVRFEPRPSEEEIKDIARSYLPDSLPPQLKRRNDKIYLGDVEVGKVYVLQ